MPISPEYAAQLQELHAKDRGFGDRTIQPGSVLQLLHVVEPVTMLDYGCGKASWYVYNEFPSALKELHFYDPGLPLNPKLREILESRGFKVLEHTDENTLLRVDLVNCRHVLEHVEPSMQEQTWAKLFTLFDKVLYVEVGLGLAVAHLPDGRNAHISHFDTTEWLGFAVDQCFHNRDVHMVDVKYVRNTRSFKMVFARGAELGEPQNKKPRTKDWSIVG